MDLFYESAPTVKKKRMHFSTFMLDIHKRMAEKQRQREEEVRRCEGKRSEVIS